MAEFRRMHVMRGLTFGVSLLALTACGGTGFDFDLRRQADTSEAAAQATAARPNPDDRGIISYPSFQVAVARQNDVVATVAQRVGLGAEELASYNGLNVGTKLRAGEVLALPRRVDDGTGGVDIASLAGNALDRADAGAGAAANSGPAQVAGVEPIQHQVVRGETAFSIARLYSVSVRSLADWNGLPADLTVREGQYLLIPVAQGQANGQVQTAALAPAPEVQETTIPGQGTPTPTPPSASAPLPEVEEPPKEEVVVAEPAPDNAENGDESANSASARLQMPVSGSIIRAYQKGTSDGIDIAASAGTPVKAAAGGTVAAITRDTDGVPILVIRHAGNLLTVYANIQDVAFEKGASVRRGQTIAKVRDTSPSFLHFEVREGFDSVDPVNYLN